ncbi:MAG: hypothetical protein ACR2L2_14800 [Acidobacteriota bacterium]
MMKRRLLIGIAFAIALLAATGSVAASDAAAGWGVLDTVGRIVNLAILLGILFFALRKSLPVIFANRREGIRRALEEAQRARQAAEAKLQSIEEKMSRLDIELESIRKSAEQEAEDERRRILEMSQQEADKIVATARQGIEGLTRNAEKELRRYAADLAVDLAETRLRHDVGEADHKKMFERFVDKLEKVQ